MEVTCSLATGVVWACRRGLPRGLSRSFCRIFTLKNSELYSVVGTICSEISAIANRVNHNAQRHTPQYLNLEVGPRGLRPRAQSISFLLCDAFTIHCGSGMRGCCSPTFCPAADAIRMKDAFQHRIEKAARRADSVDSMFWA